jgi:molecular chaperone DnaK
VDRRVIDWLAEQFERQHGIDLRGDRMALQRVKDVAERAKCELSSVKETEINLPFIISTPNNEPLHLQRSLTRKKLEDLTADLLERTLSICRRALEAKQIDKREIEDVILVGGQTRMPKLQERVADFFGLEPCKGVHPDEVVALGAAIQGSALLDEASEMLLLDVTPQALGVMIEGGYFHKLIEKNTTVPTTKSHTFTTVRDNQTSVKVLVLQGESVRAEDNELLGEFVLTGLRRAPRGQVDVEITFEISADGIVSVGATDKETGQAQSITVTAKSGLTDDEIRRMTDDEHGYAMAVRAGEEFERHKQQVERVVLEVEQLFPKVEQVLGSTDFGRDAVGKARQAVERTRVAMAGGDLHALLDAAEALQRTAQMFRGVVSKSGLT